jgi:hypothetical protein
MHQAPESICKPNQGWSTVVKQTNEEDLSSDSIRGSLFLVGRNRIQGDME